MSNQRRVIVLALADLHSGNKLALMSPDTVLKEEDEHGRLINYSPQLSAVQSTLWPWFIEDVKQVKELANGDEIIVLIVGDLVQGTKHRVLQVSPGRDRDQLAIAYANLSPVLSLPNVKHVRIVAGTAAHGGIGANTAADAVEALSYMYPNIEIQGCYHGEINIDGCAVNYAHHGPHPGSKTWLEGNSALSYLRNFVVTEWMKKAKIAARIILRAHRHTYVPIPYKTMIAGTEYEFDLVLLPSWCGIGDYARQITLSEILQQFGMVAIEIVDGQLAKIHSYIHHLNLYTEEKL